MYGNDCVLNKNNYAEYFHTLLYLDEHMAVQKLENYNMTNVPLEIVSDTRLKLQVGLGISYLTIRQLLTNIFYFGTVHTVQRRLPNGEVTSVPVFPRLSVRQSVSQSHTAFISETQLRPFSYENNSLVAVKSSKMLHMTFLKL